MTSRVLPALFLLSLTAAAFGQGFYKGYTAAPKGSEDCNPCVENVTHSVNTLRDHGETLGFNWGDDYPTITGSGTKRHWQGVQRFAPIAATGLVLPYVVVSSSHGRQSFPFLPEQAAHFAVVEFASRDTDGLRMRSNRLVRGQLTRNVAPNPLDRIIRSVDLTDGVTSGYWHAGGIQAIGKYLLIGAHSSNELEPDALISLWDMSNPAAPVPVWREKFFQNFVNSMGVIKLEDGKFLIMRATADARELDFWISPALDDVSGFLQGEQDSGFWDRWYFDELDRNGIDTNWLFDCDYILYDDGDKGYQNTNLVTDCETGEIYLIGTHGRCPGPFRLGSDFVDAYRIDIPKSRPSDPFAPGEGVFITKTAKRKMRPSANSGNVEGDFQAAGGIYPGPDNKLYVYATEQGRDGPGGSVKMIEFGPEEARSVVTTLEHAWAELYEHPAFSGRSIILDYTDRALRDYDDFANIEEFAAGVDTGVALASSIIYALPVGTKLRLFAGHNQSGPHFDLQGTGRAERIPDLTEHELSDGRSADDNFRSGAWDAVLTSSEHRSETRPPLRFALYQNYPNPFNPTTTIRYALAIDTKVVIEISNVLGQRVRSLVAENQSKGMKSVIWDGKDDFGQLVPSGVYVLRLEAADFVKYRKLTLLK